MSCADQDTETISVYARVAGKFWLAIEKHNFDLYPYLNNDTETSATMIHCGSNRGRRWIVQAHADPIVGRSRYDEIPVTNLRISTFRPTHNEAGKGQYVKKRPLSDREPVIIYKATPNEYRDSWVALGFAMSIDIPGDAPDDTYNTDLTVTMTE
jgi:hypothetical protein